MDAVEDESGKEYSAMANVCARVAYMRRWPE